jgi:hypothetical protein
MSGKRIEFDSPTDYGLDALGQPNNVPPGHASTQADKLDAIATAVQASDHEDHLPAITTPAIFGDGWNIAKISGITVTN